MRHIYTDTLPQTGNSRMQKVCVMPAPSASMTRIERTIRRRIETAISRRREAACELDDSTAYREWCYQRDRENKLRRALIQFLSR